MEKSTLFGSILFLASAFTSARAADSCPGVHLDNAAGSPPVVTGDIIQFSVMGPSPGFQVFLDGALLLYAQDPIPSNPPGTLFSLINLGAINVPYGNHILSTSWEGCILNFSNVAPPQQIDYVNVTAGFTGPSWGFSAGNYGSVSPAATSNGKTYKVIADTYNPWYGTQTSQFFACGFVSNPGRNWLTSVAVGNTTKFGSQATTFYYNSGCAYWHWSGYLGISTSGITQVIVSHN